jgi:predicted Zn-dependent peptidase
MNLQCPASRRAAAFGLRLSAAILALAAVAQTAHAQIQEPRREELLNGLKIVLAQRPGDAKVLMRLRIHTGAAFDLAGKEGLTQLLADALFPDPSVAQYVREELGGQLDVRPTYDSIDVTLGGNAAEFTRLAELLRNALLQMRLAPEEVARLREARLKAARESAQTAAAVADRAALARLFGTYPYGRPVGGTAESLARVERVDLMLARDRFLGPNNATLVVVGNFDPARTMRVLRQFLGSWRRADSLPPATFKQPEPAGARALVVDVPGAEGAEIRLVARGVARSDRDRAAAELLALVARERWRAALAPGQPGGVSAAHEAYALAGVLRMSATVPATAAAEAVESARTVLRALASAPVASAELERARQEARAACASSAGQFPFAAEWLDSITYGYDAGADARALDAVTAADLQRVAARLVRDGQLATIVAGQASTLRGTLANLSGGVEFPGEQHPPAPAAKSAPTVGRKP